MSSQEHSPVKTEGAGGPREDRAGSAGLQLPAKERQGRPPTHSRDTHREGPSPQTQERSGSVFPKETRKGA